MASKKAVLVYILEILRDETDANHTLSQEEIRSILAKKYARHSADSSQSESPIWMNTKMPIPFCVTLPAKGRRTPGHS